MKNRLFTFTVIAGVFLGATQAAQQPEGERRNIEVNDSQGFLGYRSASMDVTDVDGRLVGYTIANHQGALIGRLINGTFTPFAPRPRNRPQQGSGPQR